MAWFWSFHSRKIFYRWFHINHVPSGSRVLVGIKSVIHERSETSIPKSKTKWKYNLNCIYIPEDDNISDVEEQTAVRGDGGGQKSNIYFPIFGKFWLPQLGKNVLLFLPRAVFFLFLFDIRWTAFNFCPLSLSFRVLQPHFLRLHNWYWFW